MTNKLHIGTMGWSYNFWANNFYPPNTKPENFLQEYSKHFNTLEVNSSFYRVPSTSTIKNWDDQTKSNFLFSIKAPQKITHGKLAEENSDYLDFFLNNISILGSKLGPILFQFPPRFKSEKFDSLKNFISILPKKYRITFEIRNKTWFIDRFYQLLDENKIALVMGDSPWTTKLEKVTSEFIYFRWEGNRKQIKGNIGIVEKERTSEIKIWAKKIQNFLNKTEVFGYFSKYYSGHPPTDAKQLIEFILE